MGEHRANAARFLEVRTTRRSTMPRLCAEDALNLINAQEQRSYRNQCDYGSDEDEFSSSWNGLYAAPGRIAVGSRRAPRRSMQPFDSAPSFDQEDEDGHELEHRGRTYTQEQVESMRKTRDIEWQKFVEKEREQHELAMTEQRAGEEHRQTAAVTQAMQAVEQKARQEFDKQHGEYVKELDAYKEMAAKEKDKMEEILKAQNNELGRQVETLTQELNALQITLSRQGKPQNKNIVPPPLPHGARAGAPPPPPPAKQSTPAPPQANQSPPAPPPAMYLVSPYFEAFFLSGEGGQPKYGKFLLHLAKLNDWDLKRKSKAGGAALALASGTTDLVCGALALAGSEGSYVDMAYVNNLGDFGESPNHDLEGNANKANMERQNYMLAHWRKFQATGSIFLVKAKAGETIYVATSLSLALVSGRHEIKCLYQIAPSDAIELRTISIDEIQFYAALQVDQDVMERWFQCAQFPEEFTTSWNSSVADIQDMVYTPSNQPALGFLKK